jgi:general secretion pathway protein D
MKLTVEVSNLNGSISVTQGQDQPIIGTRTISSNIRLKDGETNFLAGLLRTDITRSNVTIPFIGDLPVIGRLVSRKKTTRDTTDLVLTLTPHIIRIPDVTEEDLTPVYVGTDANISFQGTPRIESPAGGGPFDLGRQPSVAPPRPATTPAPPAGINLAPAGPPSDIFRPAPRPTPPPGNPPSSAAPRGSAEAATASAQPLPDVYTGSVFFDFDPPTVSLAPGEQRTIVVRAGGNRTLENTSLSIRFDPNVAAAVAVRPVLADGGYADSRIEPGHVLIDIPSVLNVSSTRAIAEIVLQGIARGNSTLSFEKAPEGAGSAPVAVEVR